jgi:hypothetical protein
MLCLVAAHSMDGRGGIPERSAHTYRKKGQVMATLRIPIATYRVQFNQGFRFVDALPLVSYLHGLGITDFYASPLLRVRRGNLRS